MNAPQHPAAPLIGQPWTPETNCWWLVRAYFARCCGQALPDLAALAASGGVRATGWRRAPGDAPLPDDIVLMRGPAGGRHVGVMLQADARLGVLHCDGGMTPRGPRGCVAWQPLADVAASGYGRFEYWRRAP